MVTKEFELFYNYRTGKQCANCYSSEDVSDGYNKPRLSIILCEERFRRKINERVKADFVCDLWRPQ
jgi:hypothetical protein